MKRAPGRLIIGALACAFITIVTDHFDPELAPLAALASVVATLILAGGKL